MAASSDAPPISFMTLSTMLASTKHLFDAVSPMTDRSRSSASTTPSGGNLCKAKTMIGEMRD